jgi:GNAT superfamily N-acetyltransferase
MGEENYDPTKALVGDNPKHKQLMAWRSTDELGTHDIHYHHGSMGFGTAEHNFAMHDSESQFVATMGLGHDGEIKHIEVHPDLRRQGLATKLYKFGQEIHETIHTIPAPEHSVARTAAGNAWAKSASGEQSLPRLEHVDDSDYNHRRWSNLKDVTIPQLKSHISEFHAKMIENGMDKKGMADARYHVESAHDYLDQANKVGPKHPDYSDHMFHAHGHIDELGDIHSEWYGNMEDHEKLQDHIGKLY